MHILFIPEAATAQKGNFLANSVVLLAPPSADRRNGEQRITKSTTSTNEAARSIAKGAAQPRLKLTERHGFIARHDGPSRMPRPKLQCMQTGIIRGHDFCADMTNNAQTTAVTSAALGLRRDCILVAEADLRRSKDRFRPQPVWNYQFGAPRGLSARPEDCACKARLSRDPGRKWAFRPAGPE